VIVVADAAQLTGAAILQNFAIGKVMYDLDAKKK
jgi:hypothetical protein